MLFEALDATAEHGYPDRAGHMRYVDNHDEDRYLDECGAASLQAAVGATFTLPGTPMIYDGQEPASRTGAGRCAGTTPTPHCGLPPAAAAAASGPRGTARARGVPGCPHRRDRRC